ncbi:hypothetical protein GWI33_017337 [Rhynchophorus ferrugineus]|uniref:Uncharacterized protein n=1 Tax=Rhynchophorus ferrugineus TaxID=354439 RepID=A0A834M694_RHYFE|nr:hypothetical protein GWI33_017337 [Rhynchophorus ferrugineus]
MIKKRLALCSLKSSLISSGDSDTSTLALNPHRRPSQLNFPSDFQLEENNFPGRERAAAPAAAAAAPFFALSHCSKLGRAETPLENENVVLFHCPFIGMNSVRQNMEILLLISSSTSRLPFEWVLVPPLFLPLSFISINDA